jgi:hypothetical protein
VQRVFVAQARADNLAEDIYAAVKIALDAGADHE